MVKKGRPRKLLNEKQIEELAKIQCTRKEIAAVMDCDVDLLREHYSHLIENGSQKGKMSLRRTQFKISLRNSSMAIFLGKVYLDQKDNNSDQDKEKEFNTYIVSYADAPDDFKKD